MFTFPTKARRAMRRKLQAIIAARPDSAPFGLHITATDGDKLKAFASKHEAALLAYARGAYILEGPPDMFRKLHADTATMATFKAILTAKDVARAITRA